MYKKSLLFFALLFSLAGVTHATDYIKEVMVVGGSSSEVNNLRITLEAQGWTRINKDLNDRCGASSDYIYLFYRAESNNDGVNRGYITDFYISNATGTVSSTVTHDGRTYHLVSCDGSNYFRGRQGDLNSHAGGATIHLYYTTDLFPDNRAVTSISFNDSQSGAVPANGSGSGYDLNDGCGSGTDYIYMHVGTSTAVPPTLTVAANDPLLGSVSATGFITPAETLLTVITPTASYPNLQYSESGRATLNLSGFLSINQSGAWSNSSGLGGINMLGHLEVTANEGYTVTRITFNVGQPANNYSNPIEIAQPPFLIDIEGGDCFLNNGNQYVGYHGVTSINVYGYLTPVDQGNVT